jgi:thymidylate kinase
VTDRAFSSTGAYQGFAEGGDLKQIEKITKVVMGDCMPDLIILLDISVKTAMERKTDKEGDPYDHESIKYFEKLVDGYRYLAKTNWCGVKWVSNGLKLMPSKLAKKSKRMSLWQFLKLTKIKNLTI